MKSEVINIKDKMNLVDEFWTPKIIEQFNDYHLKIAKFKGDFTWHDHKETDEVFMVIKGQMTIELRDKTVDLYEGDLYVVPKGVEHKPKCQNECEVLLIEPKGTINTGDKREVLTASNKEWV